MCFYFSPNWERDADDGIFNHIDGNVYMFSWPSVGTVNSVVFPSISIFLTHFITHFFFCSSLFTNSNWFDFKDDGAGDAARNASTTDAMDDINLNGISNGGNSSSDDEVVVGEDEDLADGKNSVNGSLNTSANILNGGSEENSPNGELNTENEKIGASGEMGFFRFDPPENDDLFGDRPIPDWVAWGDTSDFQVSGSGVNPFLDQNDSNVNNSVEPVGNPTSPTSSGDIVSNGTSTSTGSNASSSGSDSSQKSASVPSLFEEDVEFVGVELEGTEKAMEQALKEGIVGEAGPLKRNLVPKKPEKENTDDDGAGIKEFNDANYWRVEQEVAVLE